MQLHFKFSNLLGTVYKKGNIQFTADGNTVISPVGNRLTLFDLDNHHSETLPIESRLNITTVALNPSGTNLLLVNEGGEGLYISLISRTVLHRHRFNKTVRDIKFSPDGKKFAVCRDADVQLFRAPGPWTHQYNPFYLERTFHASHEATNFLDWSFDSNLLAAACKDMKTVVMGGRPFRNLFLHSLAGHTGSVVACFFLEDQKYDLVTLDERGFLVHWICNIQPNDLQPLEKEPEKGNEEEVKMEEDASPKLQFTKKIKHGFHEAVPGHGVSLKCAAYHKKNRLLVTGFSNGAFALHEMPDFNLIHNLSVWDESIRSVCVNGSGDWLGVACAGAAGSAGQLLVWEWQSETYVMKQQGHVHEMTCLAFSPDGHQIATGGEDGKTKVWEVRTGFCLVTFGEHTGGITGVAWTQAGKAVLSSSLDGSIRAFDLKRYRNFRTLTAASPVQLSCLCVDASGELVCAGARDVFDIFLWSLQTGRLLDVLSGHEAPVSGVAFNPVSSTLASTSWDKTLRTWDVFDGKGATETIQLSSEGLCVQFSPNGKLVAALTNNSQIALFDWRDAAQQGLLETKLDLDSGRGQADQITAHKSTKTKSFTNFCFSADGEYLVAGGQSKHICIYNVPAELLVRKFTVTCNLSLDAVADYVDPRKMSEFGNLNLIDGSDSEDEGGARLKLPGVKKGDLSQRISRPEIRVSGVQFSPTGRVWGACSTEGLLLYSLDDASVFDPFQLHSDVTPETIQKQLEAQEFGNALLMALKLNDPLLISDCFQSVPVAEIETLSKSLPLLYVEKLLRWIGGESLATTKHLEFYLQWVRGLLVHHGSSLKLRSQENIPTFTALQQIISQKQRELGEICDRNKYTVRYLLQVTGTKQRRNKEPEVSIEDS